MRAISILVLAGLWLVNGVQANPYPDPDKVPKDPPLHIHFHTLPRLSAAQLRRVAEPVLRVDLNWDADKDVFVFAGAVREASGTPTLLKRALRPNPLGSYQGTLVDNQTGQVLAYDALGTGQEFRRLTRALTFRFPEPGKAVTFHLKAENPATGKREEVLTQAISTAAVKNAILVADPEVRLVQAATAQPALIVNFYADGYTAARKEQFFQDAQKAVQVLQQKNFPLLAHFDIRGVFAPSQQTLDTAQDLGLPIPERDSFLGLYYPYWRNFGRWYNVVYPTRESKYRNALATVPYDYPIALMDNSEYWGIGNFNELTAVPSSHPSFGYLLTHEFGHYYGLNEEYEGGGPTELAFAPGIDEPWSQNNTFLRDPSQLKWKHWVADSTPIPTPDETWDGTGPYGAYLGGYADTEPLHQSHKPGQACVMSAGANFCSICREAIEAKINFDLGG